MRRSIYAAAAAAALVASAGVFMQDEPYSVRGTGRWDLKPPKPKAKRTRPFKGSKAAKRATKRGGRHGR